MKSTELQQLITCALNTAIQKVFKGVALSATINRAQAYRLYGRHNVDRWIAEGLVKIEGLQINRLQIASIANACNRLSYETIKRIDHNG